MERRGINNAYVYGNTVRKTAPRREERVYIDGERVRLSRREMMYRERALKMNAPYVLFLAFVSAFCLAMAVVYLGVQSDIKTARRDITELKNNINTVTAKNEAIDYSINTYISSEHVIKVATKELGMVEADSEHVVFYNNTDSEYTVQYKDIPSK
ncbi:MAG: cell division protein FtsL [Lachnospiraceae bacterium]|nr:cell division protein FtsL [Lachnospiraceae bacterium]